MNQLKTLPLILPLILASVTPNTSYAETKSTQPVKTKLEKALLKNKISAVALKPVTEAIGAAEFGPASKKVVKEVTLSDSIKVEINGVPVELKRATSGLRQKKVALFWASVYVGQVFTNASVDFTSVKTLNESLASGLPVAVTMTFVRDIGIEKIVDGYKEVFAANGVKIQEEPFESVLAAVRSSGDVKDKQTYYFTFAKTASGKGQFSFWTNGKERFFSNDVTPEMQKQLLGMWFGKAIDAGLEQLQEQFLKHE